MKTERIKVGDRVEKTGSLSDYATGRQGEIIEMDYDNQRARVCWDMSPKLEPMKPIRTWVNFRYLSDPIEKVSTI